jgi:hypothetical protein
MLLQTNSYIVPRDKRAEHARLLRRFRQTLLRLGCDHFEVYEQVGPNWSSQDSSGRFVQIMRFRDRKHQTAVQTAERNDPAAQTLLKEFCELINLNYQQQQGLFAVGYYTSFLRMPTRPESAEQLPQSPEAAGSEESPQDEAPDVLPMPGLHDTPEESETSETSQEGESAEASEEAPEAAPAEELETAESAVTSEESDDSIPLPSAAQDNADDAASPDLVNADGNGGDVDTDPLFVPDGIADSNEDTGVTPALDDQPEESENSANEAAPPAEDENEPHKNPFSPFSS